LAKQKKEEAKRKKYLDLIEKEKVFFKGKKCSFH